MSADLPLGIAERTILPDGEKNSNDVISAFMTTFNSADAGFGNILVCRAGEISSVPRMWIFACISKQSYCRLPGRYPAG